MKITTRDDFRVKAVIAPHNPRHLGLGELPGQIISGNVEIVIAPTRLGDLGWVSMSDRLASNDIEGDYRRRCEEILAVLRAEKHVVSAEITFTETVSCSHCGYGWEEVTADDLAADPSLAEQPGDGVGLPLCCDEAQEEWRAAAVTDLTARIEAAIATYLGDLPDADLTDDIDSHDLAQAIAAAVTGSESS